MPRNLDEEKHLQVSQSRSYDVHKSDYMVGWLAGCLAISLQSFLYSYLNSITNPHRTVLHCTHSHIQVTPLSLSHTHIYTSTLALTHPYTRTSMSGKESGPTVTAVESTSQSNAVSERDAMALLTRFQFPSKRW